MKKWEEEEDRNPWTNQRSILKFGFNLKQRIRWLIINKRWTCDRKLIKIIYYFISLSCFNRFCSFHNFFLIFFNFVLIFFSLFFFSSSFFIFTVIVFFQFHFSIFLSLFLISLCYFLFLPLPLPPCKNILSARVQHICLSRLRFLFRNSVISVGAIIRKIMRPRCKFKRMRLIPILLQIN